MFVICLHPYSNSLGGGETHFNLCISTHQGVRGPDGDRGEPGSKGGKVGGFMKSLKEEEEAVNLRTE